MERIYDAPIMLIFFNRPDALAQVFAWVRRMQPKQLFLVQDGPRADRPDDMGKILACRKIVENVDWECEVHKNYAEQNMSCDHREFTGISWCFQFVDRLIILEDDCVPADSFYSFCAELLERYKDDPRIYGISGFSRVGDYELTPYDYVFSRAAAGWGWATWRRCWDCSVLHQTLDFVDDERFMKYYEKVLSNPATSYEHQVLQRAIQVKAYDEKIGKVSSWEYLSRIAVVLNRQMIITPRVNMIKYVGFSEDATHSGPSAELLNHKLRKVLTQDAKELTGTLRHPQTFICDTEFEKRDRAAMKINKTFANIELLWLRIRHGQWSSVGKAIGKRLKKIGKRRCVL